MGRLIFYLDLFEDEAETLGYVDGQQVFVPFTPTLTLPYIVRINKR